MPIFPASCQGGSSDNQEDEPCREDNLASVQLLLWSLSAFPLTSHLFTRGFTVCACAGHFRAPPLDGEEALASPAPGLCHQWMPGHGAGLKEHCRAHLFHKAPLPRSIYCLLLFSPHNRLRKIVLASSYGYRSAKLKK